MEDGDGEGDGHEIPICFALLCFALFCAVLWLLSFFWFLLGCVQRGGAKGKGMWRCNGSVHNGHLWKRDKNKNGFEVGGVAVCSVDIPIGIVDC